MEKIPKQQFEFYVFHQKKKKSLTPQQQKIKKIAQVSKVCLRNEQSEDTQGLFKCMVREAKVHLSAL